MPAPLPGWGSTAAWTTDTPGAITSLTDMTTVVGAGPTAWAPRDAATIAMVTITAVVAMIAAVVMIRVVVIEMMAGVAGTAGTLRLTGPRRVGARRPPFPDGLEGTEFKGAGVLSANF